MAPKTVPDIRLIERSQRKTMSSAGAADVSGLPDLAPNVAEVSAEDLEKLKNELTTEHDLRVRRIERFIKEGPLRPAPRAVIPVSENDL